MTGYGDIQMSVRAMKAGAGTFSPSRFEIRDMPMRLTIAVELESDSTHRSDQVGTLKRDTIDCRARATGMTSLRWAPHKQIAAELGIRK